MQMEFEKKAAEERVKRSEMYDSTLEERAREQAAQLAEARDQESQHRATAAQMRLSILFYSVCSALCGFVLYVYLLDLKKFCSYLAVVEHLWFIG